MKSIQNIIFILFFSTSHSFAESVRTVRFWEGQKPENVSTEEHNAFVANVLAPATVGYKAGYLESYNVYLPPTEALPKDAYLEHLPFSEAATPTYTNAIVYQESNVAAPAYGPLHFLKNGFVQGDQSYSATPQVFDPEKELKISAAQPRTARVAYSLRNYLRRPGNLYEKASKSGDEYEEVDWQAGHTIVWLQLRNKGVSDEKYKESLKFMFSDLQKAFFHNVDGHLVRVDEGHLLHFINLTQNVAQTHTVLRIMEILQTIESSYAHVVQSFDLVLAKNLKPFEKGWTEAFVPGSAVNVQFLKPSELKSE